MNEGGSMNDTIFFQTVLDGLRDELTQVVQVMCVHGKSEEDKEEEE